MFERGCLRGECLRGDMFEKSMREMGMFEGGLFEGRKERRKASTHKEKRVAEPC